jgi:hypothetical protein
MSVMIASAETTSKIASLLFCVVEYGFNHQRISLSSKSCDTIRKIIRQNRNAAERLIYEALQALNLNSYNTRYQGRHQEYVIQEPYKPAFFKSADGFYNGENGAEDYQKLKSVQFLLYQCDNHDGSEKHKKLYSVLDELVTVLGFYIIGNVAEYKSATWD